MINEKPKILIAEDEGGIRDIITSVLQDNFPSFDFESFENGASLEKRLLNVEGVKAILTDNNMPPGITGSEIIEKYARMPEYSDIKFILCYGGDPEIGRKAMENGASAILMKPFGMEDYIAFIRKSLDL